MEVCLFEGIEPDPSVETVMKGAKAMEEFKPDWIVAMGGGSPIDAAKQCGSSMNIRTLRLKICARYSEFEAPKKLTFLRDLFHIRNGDGSDGIFHHYGL